MPKKNPFRILVYDIEATNLVGDFGQVICVGYKWYGDARKTPTILRIDDYPSFKKDRTDDSEVCKAFFDLAATADMCITWYGKVYDHRFLQTRLVYAGHNERLDAGAHLDLYYTARFKLKLSSNRLASVQRFLGLADAKTELNCQQWAWARAGYKKGIDYVVDHCKKDVLVTEQAYERLRPLVSQHPNLNQMRPNADGDETKYCSACGSSRVKQIGYIPEITNRWIKYRCENCLATLKAPPRYPWRIRSIK